MSAIDDAPPEAPGLFLERIIMDARHIVIKPRGRHMLRLFDGDAIDMVDFFVDSIIIKPIGAARCGKVPTLAVDARARITKISGRYQLGEGWNNRRAASLSFTLSHHDPANIVEHRRIMLVEGPAAHVNGAGLAGGMFLEPNHLRFRAQRIARRNWHQKPALGVAEIGYGVQRNIRNRPPEH